VRWFKKGKGNGGILMEGRIGPLVWRKGGKGRESRPCKGREEKIWIIYCHIIINSNGDER